MKKKTARTLRVYEDACYDIIKLFIETYFCDDEIKIYEINYYNIGNECDGVVQVNDYFFSVSDMYKALSLEATREQLFAHYDMSLDNSMLPEKKQKTIPSLKNYVLMTNDKFNPT